MSAFDEEDWTFEEGRRWWVQQCRDHLSQCFRSVSGYGNPSTNIDSRSRRVRIEDFFRSFRHGVVIVEGCFQGGRREPVPPKHWSKYGIDSGWTDLRLSADSLRAAFTAAQNQGSQGHAMSRNPGEGLSERQLSERDADELAPQEASATVLVLAKKKRGPPKGKGKFVERDRRLFPAITKFVSEGLEIHDAVGRLVDRIASEVQDASKIKRVYRRYCKEVAKPKSTKEDAVK